jgi:hypothetical protein
MRVWSALSLFESVKMKIASEMHSRNGWEGVKCASLDDMRTQNILFWQRQGAAAIRQAAWELVVETWQAQRRNPDELRFRRLAPAFRKA